MAIEMRVQGPGLPPVERRIQGPGLPPLERRIQGTGGPTGGVLKPIPLPAAPEGLERAVFAHPAAGQLGKARNPHPTVSPGRITAPRPGEKYRSPNPAIGQIRQPHPTISPVMKTNTRSKVGKFTNLPTSVPATSARVATTIGRTMRSGGLKIARRLF